ncbi:MAG: hypothetical protein ACO1OB_05940 [Archangium sp.]
MWRPALLILLCSCATSQPKPTTAAVDQPDQQTRADPDSNEELAKAWDREEPKAVAAPQRPTAEVVVDRTLAFKDAMTAGQSALKRKQLDDARTFASAAVKEAASLDGHARLQAHQLAFKVEVAASEKEAAIDAADAWLAACGPEKAEACRNAAISALTTMSKSEPSLVRRVKDLRDDETCASRAERAAKPQPCEGVALSRANKHDDAWLAQKLLLARASREKDEHRLVALYEKAEGACREARCASLRRKALTKLINHAKSKNDVDGATTYAIREVAVINEALPEQHKRWSRTPTLDAACASYDKAHGAGTCRALEKKTLGYWTFKDWSRDSAGTGLTSEHVRQVNEHFAPLLQECLNEQAKRMTPPDAARFEVRWVVFNDGRVGEAHLRRDLDETLLAKCLRAQFDGWRYPRYEGEYQNVEQSFTVTAVERRYR